MPKPKVKTKKTKAANAKSTLVASATGPTRRLPSAWQLTKTSARLIWQYKQLFAGITLIYGLLNMLLVQGLAGSDSSVTGLKHTLDQTFNGNLGGLASGIGIFAIMLGSAGNSSSQTAGAYQVILLLIGSLAIIWTLRQLSAGHDKFRIRDAFYQGVYPFVPLILVLLVIGLQLLPMVIGTGLYSTVVANGIAVYGWEKLAWALLALILSVLSLYLICSSIFAVYIVTLPAMAPVKALRSARGLVKGRRVPIIRKLLFLPLIMLVGAAVIMLPIIAWLTPLAQWVFFILTMFSLVAAHTYIYQLYRELLND